MDVLATLFVLAETQPHEWSYVAWSYGIVFVALALYAARTIVRGRKVGRQLPPDERRWM